MRQTAGGSEAMMSTENGLDMDMCQLSQWPGRVRVRIRINHLQGPPEECRLMLNRGAVPRAVTVGPDPGPSAGAAGRHLLWQELPGRTLRLRSLAVVAASLFDSVKMAPRICGLPIYRAVSIALAAEGDERRATQVEVVAEGGTSRATLRHRRGHEDLWAERPIVLARWDADPLRAVLRLAMGLHEEGGPQRPAPAVRGRLRREAPGPAVRARDAMPLPAAAG
jgi:hypothetical protein